MSQGQPYGFPGQKGQQESKSPPAQMAGMDANWAA